MLVGFALAGLAPAGLVLTGCKDNQDDTSDTSVALSGPELSHTASLTVGEGGPLDLELTAVDDDGVGAVTVYHRTAGNTGWIPLVMTGGENGTFTASITDTDVQYPAIEYYFKAADAAATAATSYLPVTDPTSNAYSVAVSVQGAALPYFENFEGDDGSSVDLATLGWGSAMTGFQGYPWQSSTVEVYSGVSSAFHPLGYEGAVTSSDWLISPAIDLTSAASAQVSWREFGNFTATANHALYISTTNRDPGDGTYTLVTALGAPLEDAWSRSQVVDLAAYVGSTVYVAWYWEGAGADDWYIDDVQIGGLQADLTEIWTLDPETVHPGDSTTLTVTVSNASTVDATDAVVTVGFPSGGVSPDADSVAVGFVPAGGAASATFTLTVDEGQEDNRYVPMTVGVSSGDAEDIEEARLLIGYASTATVDWTSDVDGWLQIDLGVGAVEDPGWSTTLHAETTVAGPVTASSDITDQGDMLPPAAGDLRWWTHVESDGGGAVTGFSISYGGQSYDATSLPSISGGASAVCWDPEPPAFTVSAASSPASLEPGSTGVSLSLRIKDIGAATSGPVTATLSTTDADVTITDGAAVSVSTDPMAFGETVVVSAFRFDVAATHVDSSDLSVDITLDDGVESWVVPVSLPVPYPVFTVTSIEIDDSAGNDDGILDPGEAATLTINLANTGDDSASGAVTGLLSVASTSVATADVGADSELFGSLPRGSTADARFDVTVTGGSAGEVLDLELTLTDDDHTYSSTAQILLGEPVWNVITADDDSATDAIEGWDFDMVNGTYRVFDGVMQIRLVSSVVYDPSSLFVEAWGLSAGADYTYYRIVAQSGLGTLEGYSGSTGMFSELPAPIISSPDEYTVQFDFPVADLELFSDKLQLGFGSGWCGEPEYYCDQFPDNWGYPYASFSTADWFSLTW